MKPYLVLLVTFIISLTFISGIETTSFIIKNNCDYTIWPATQTSANSPAIGNTGFVLQQGFSLAIDAPSNWNGRIWARTLCGSDASGKFVCSVGDCGSGNVSCDGNGGNIPITLAEFGLNTAGGMDFYDISLVDGFNVPLTITPGNTNCESTGCSKDLNSFCPWNLVVRDETNQNDVIACKSACSVFNTAADCCTGNFSTPESCTASDYAKLVKFQCPQSFTYPFEQENSTYSCPTGGDYFINFCAPTSPQYIGMLCLP